MRLKDIFEYRTPQMRVAARMFRHRRVMVESRHPQTGVYLWLPTPDGDWELDVYFKEEIPGMALHYNVWSRYVIDKLATLWGKDPDELRALVGNRYLGLPRGRVDDVSHREYVVMHGDTAPVPNAMSKVLSAFNLRAMAEAGSDRLRIVVDDHEKLIPEDTLLIGDALGIDLEPLLSFVANRSGH